MFVPADVLLEIAAHVEHSDWVNLSLVCFAWADALVPKVRTRLVYLVRHSKHSQSLEQHLAKHGHLIRELYIGDSRKMSVKEHTVRDYIALRTWLKSNCHQITRLRVVSSRSAGGGGDGGGDEPYNIAALLGYIGAIPFQSNNHRQVVMSRCPDKLADVLLSSDDEAITGWKYSFLGLANLHGKNCSSSDDIQIRWWLASDWVERLSISNTHVPLYEARTWNKLRILQQLEPAGILLAGNSHSIPFHILPQLQCVTPMRYGDPKPTGLDKLPSKCSGSLRDICIRNRSVFDAARHFAGMRPDVSVFEEIMQFPKMNTQLLESEEACLMLDVRSMTIDGHLLHLYFSRFYDVIAVEVPMVSLEYLQLIGIDRKSDSVVNDGVMRFMNSIRLLAIPDRFPNLKYLLIEYLPQLTDYILNGILFVPGTRQLRLRKLRNITVNNCGTTVRSVPLINEVNKRI